MTTYHVYISIIDSKDLNLSGYKTIYKRIINDDRQLNFRKDVERKEHVLEEIIKNSHLDIDGSYVKYFNEIRDTYNANFPIVKKKIHSKAFSKPWMTEEILKMIKKKNKLYSKKLKAKDDNIIKKKFKQVKKQLEKSKCN